MTKPKNFEKVITYLAEKLGERQYSIRGTASLVLQGIEMNVDDIDVVCDKATALAFSTLIGEEYEIEKIKYSESSKFKSYFGKYLIDNVKVEVMGEWRIKKPNGQWLSPFDGSDFTFVSLSGAEGARMVKVTTVESELKMFAAMGRWNAFHKIKKQVVVK